VRQHRETPSDTVLRPGEGRAGREGFTVTDLKRPVSRRTSLPVDRRYRVVVTLLPGDLIAFRLERTRKSFVTTLRACYELAVQVHVAAERAAKKKAKENKR